MENTFNTAVNPSRRGFLKATGAIGLGAAIAATLAACGGKEEKKAEGGKDKVIKAAISYELGTNNYDPMLTTGALTLAANWHILEGLTDLHPVTREVYAALGSDLPKKIDDTTYEVELRKDAKFADGKPVTMDDVLFSFERVLDPANKSLYASFLPFLDKVEKKDDKTVTIKTKYAFGLVAERLSVVKIVPKAVVEKDGEAWKMMPLGSGPYKMTSNGSGRDKKVVFEANEHYNGQHKAGAAKMEWTIEAAPDGRVNMLTSGKVSAIDSVGYGDIERVGKTHKVESVQGFGLLFMIFNCKNGPFADVRNRQALLYGIDMEKVVKNGLSGQAAPATCFVHKEHPAYKEAKVVYAYDAEKAKALLTETGLAGKEITLDATDHGWVKPCSKIIKESLDGLGLKVKLVEQQSSAFYTKITSTPEEDKTNSYTVGVAPGDPTVFGNDADLLMRWWYGTDLWVANRMYWGGPDYDKLKKLMDDAVAIADKGEQKKAWGDCFDYISEQVPLYPLFHRKAPTAWDEKTLEGFKPISLTGLSFVDVSAK